VGRLTAKMALPSSFHPHGGRIPPLLDFFVLHPGDRASADLNAGSSGRTDSSSRLLMRPHQ